MRNLRKIMSKLTEVLSLKLRLLFLIKFRIKMYFEAKNMLKNIKREQLNF